jgi:hypothetical protein
MLLLADELQCRVSFLRKVISPRQCVIMSSIKEKTFRVKVGKRGPKTIF